MGEFWKWLPQNLWAELSIVGALGLAVAVLTILFVYLFPNHNDDKDDTLLAAKKERQRLLLFCGDATALATLAVQRDTSDGIFLRRFRALPAFDALFPHFGDQFRQTIVQTTDDSQKSLCMTLRCKNKCDGPIS